MKKFLLLSLLSFCICRTQAQVVKFDRVFPIWNEFALNNFQQTSDGGYILSTDAVPEMDTVANIGKGYLVKLNSLGTTQWIKRYPKTTYFMKSTDGNSVFQTADGGYIIGTTEYTNSNPFGNTAIYLIKTDVSGNMLWSKTYSGVGNSSCYCVKQTADLGYIACGNTIDTITNAQYVYLLKTDGAGVVQWGKTYAEPSGQNGIAYCVNQTSDGGYVVSGSSYSGAFVMKTDNAGAILWNNNFGMTGSDELHCVKQTYDGGYIATGFGNGSIGYIGTTLLKLDGAGSIQWEKIYRTSSSTSFDEGFVVEEVPGGYVVAQNVNFSKIGLLKTDVSGNAQWATKYVYGYCFTPSGLERTTDGGYAFTCIYHDNFVAGVEVIKTDSLGSANCGDSLLTVITNNYSPPINPNFVAANIAPSAPIVTVFTNVTLADSALCPGTGQEGIGDLIWENSVRIFPNPTSGNFSVQMNLLSGNKIRIEIFDVLGQMVMERKEENVSGNFQEDFDLSAMSDGIYFVAVKVDDTVVITKKVVKGN